MAGRLTAAAQHGQGDPFAGALVNESAHLGLHLVVGAFVRDGLFEKGPHMARNLVQHGRGKTALKQGPLHPVGRRRSRGGRDSRVIHHAKLVPSSAVRTGRV